MTDPVHFVREDVRGFLAMLEAMARPHMDEMPVEEARAGDIISMAGLAVATVSNTIACGFSFV